jgi:exopolysaccharide production protein ExoZ
VAQDSTIDVTADTSAEAVRPPDRGAEYLTLQAWRGVASLWVVMLHSSPSPGANGFPDHLSNLLVAIGSQGYLAVPLFFVISGYCIANAATSALSRGVRWQGYAWARFRRIYPPYVATIGLAVLLSLVVGALVGAGFIRPNFLSALHFFGNDAVYYFAQFTLTQVPLQQKPLFVVFWSLSYEVAFYVIVGLICFTRARQGDVHIVLSRLHVVTLFSLLLFTLKPAWCVFPFDLWPQFGLGVAVFDVLTQPRKAYHKAGFGLLGLLTIWLASSLAWSHAATEEHRGEVGIARVMFGPAAFLVALAFAAALIGLRGFDVRISQWHLTRGLARVGLFSYSLYLVHLLPVGIIYLASRQLAVPLGLTPVLMAVQMLIALCFSYVFYILFERPFHRPTAKRKAAGAPGPSPAGSA